MTGYWPPRGGGNAFGSIFGTSGSPIYADAASDSLYIQGGTGLQTYGDGVEALRLDSLIPGTNYAVNGGFDIWESVYGTFPVCWSSTSTSWTKNSSDIPTESNCRYYATKTVGSGANINFIHRTEGAVSSALVGKPVTISFWAKAEAWTGALTVKVDSPTVLDTFSTLSSQVAITTVAYSMTIGQWNRYAINFTPTSNAAKGLQITIDHSTSGQASGLSLTGLKIEIDKSANVPYIPLPTAWSPYGGSYSAEAAMCGRYVQEFSYTSMTGPVAIGAVISATNIFIIFDFKQAMHHAPVFAGVINKDKLLLYQGTTTKTLGTFSLDGSNIYGAGMFLSSSALTTGYSVWIETDLVSPPAGISFRAPLA